MKVETLGWMIVVVFGALAVVLWSSLPKLAIIFCVVTVVVLSARLLFGRRM